MKSNVKADFVMPIAVLMLICLVMSALLAGTNFITEPIIAAGDAQRAEQARIDVLPAADGFNLMNIAIPEGNSVTEVYEATNGAGYVFMISTTGYGAKGSLQLICSINSEGKLDITFMNDKTISIMEKLMSFHYDFCDIIIELVL